LFLAYFVVPKTSTEWWLNKINKNISNDMKAEEKLKAAGWKVITIWECELKKSNSEITLKSIAAKISKA
jgi:DNA mismatch endonuclease (patch repair protein)